MNQSEYLDKSELLNVTRISESTLYRQMNKGEFPKNIKIGLRRVVWNRKEVNSWIKKQEWLSNLKKSGL